MERIEQAKITDRVVEIVDSICQEAERLKSEGIARKSQLVVENVRMYQMNRQFTDGFDFSQYDKQISHALDGLED
jgi:hypothetical protein